MKTYEIREDGNKIATIKARCAASALNKAAKECRLRACDYNGYVGPVTWAAFLPDEPYALAKKTVQVRP